MRYFALATLIITMVFFSDRTQEDSNQQRQEAQRASQKKNKATAPGSIPQ